MRMYNCFTMLLELAERDNQEVTSHFTVFGIDYARVSKKDRSLQQVVKYLL